MKSSLKPITTRFDQITEGARGMMWRGRLMEGYPDRNNLPDDLKYIDPLTNYEVHAYDVRYSHALCFKCYDKLLNKARFGLCANCYNREDHQKLPVSDAKKNKIYLSRRGTKIVIVGDLIKLPVYGEGSNKFDIVTWEMIYQRPYIDIARRESCTPDFAMKIGKERWYKLHSHGILPLEYLLAELD